MRVDVFFDEDGTYAIRYKEKAIAPGPGPLPPPPVLFLGSVAACAGVFALDYLRTRALPFDGLHVIGEAGHADNPRRLTDIAIQVVLLHPVHERHLAPLRRAVDLCTLKNSLMHPPVVMTELTMPKHAPAGAA